jgi:hypothetical protein
MLGKTEGVVACIKALVPSCSSSHCVVHQQALVVKTVQANLKNVLDDTIKTVNHIISKTLNAGLFKILCKEMGSEHTTLLLFTDVRWLSKGKEFVRVFELQ